MKSSPHLGPTKAPPTTTSQASPIQRAMMNRQQAARSSSTSVMPPLQPVNTNMHSGQGNVYSHPSPYPRNPPQISSPSTSRPSDFAMQGGLSSPTSNFPPQRLHQQQRPQPRPQRNSFTQQSSFPRRPSDQSATQSGPIPGKPPFNPPILSALSPDLFPYSHGNIVIDSKNPFLHFNLSSFVKFCGSRLTR
jgi:hypothetical protein